MNTKEKIKVMQAYENDKIIQIYVNDNVKWVDWVEKNEPKWNWDYYEYRIKPEELYRPFHIIFDDSRKILGKVVEPKRGKEVDSWVYTITGIRIDHDLVHISSHAGEEWISYKRLFEEYVFGDGSPCGVKIDE